MELTRDFKKTVLERVQHNPEFAPSNYWLKVLLDKPDMELRNEILEETNKWGIMTRPVWMLLHKLPMYRGCPGRDLSMSESLEARIVNIPGSAYLAGGGGGIHYCPIRGMGEKPLPLGEEEGLLVDFALVGNVDGAAGHSGF